jgi:hypothetical protein
MNFPDSFYAMKNLQKQETGFYLIMPNPEHLAASAVIEAEGGVQHRPASARDCRLETGISG